MYLIDKLVKDSSKESSTSLDDYWDKNNLFVRLLLIGLLIVIAVGSVITILSYFNLK